MGRMTLVTSLLLLGLRLNVIWAESSGPILDAPPRIILHPPKEILLIKDIPVEIPCQAQENSQVSYSWTKDGELLKMGSGIRHTPGLGTIIIDEADTGDEGVYQCLVSNSLGVAVSVKAVLRNAFLLPFAPVTSPKLYRHPVGSPLTLHCDRPSSYPVGTIYWGYVESRDQLGSKTHPIEYSARVSSDYEGVLHFSNIEMGDSLGGANYICVLQVSELRSLVQGYETRIFPEEISAQPIPRVPYVMWASPRNDVAMWGKVKKMKCIFAGLPTPVVSWTRVGENLQEKVMMSSFGQELIIPDVDYKDAGRYECIANNTATSTPIRHTFSLVVESHPTWKYDRPPVDVTVAEGESAVINCSTQGVPMPTVSWYINGQPLSDMGPRTRIIVGNQYIRFLHLTTADVSVIQCNASNKHGYLFANVVLNIIGEVNQRQEKILAFDNTDIYNRSPSMSTTWNYYLTMCMIIILNTIFKLL